MLQWRKSARSSSTGSNCVELADAAGRVAVRDSKNPEQGHITVSRAAMRRFLDEVRR